MSIRNAGDISHPVVVTVTLVVVTRGNLTSTAYAVTGVHALVRKVAVARVEFAVTYHPVPTDLITVGVTEA